MKKRKGVEVGSIISDISNFQKAFIEAFGKRYSEFRKTVLSEVEIPYSEITQGESVVEIKIKMPNISKRNLSLKIDDEKVEVRGKVNSGPDKKEFYKLIGLPSDTDIELAKAHYRDGVLHIRIPWSKEES